MLSIKSIPRRLILPLSLWYSRPRKLQIIFDGAEHYQKPLPHRHQKNSLLPRHASPYPLAPSRAPFNKSYLSYLSYSFSLLEASHPPEQRLQKYNI